jgi:high-affinity iron transporter
MFDVGAFTSGFLTGLREGVEAALIVAIVCAYLARTGNARHFGKIAAGVGVAVATSLVVGAAIFVTLGGLHEPYEQIFEGLAMLLAAGVVTWMLFWMRRQASSAKGDLQRAVDRVLTEGTAWGLSVLAFTAVIREGLETALFLVGQATSAAAGEAGAAGAASVLGGALAGLAIAVVLGYGFYRGSRALDLRHFFRWTGALLVFMAAGLLSNAVHELVEIGWIAVATGTAFDVSAILPHDAGIGLFLRAVFGYTSTPEWVTLVTWATYVAVVLSLYLRPMPSRPAIAPTEPTETAASGA